MGEERRGLLPPGPDPDRAAHRFWRGLGAQTRAGDRGIETPAFGRALYALGIEEVGEVTGRNLANQFRTVDALLEATPDQIEATPGVGPKMAHLIHEQLTDPQMRELISDLRGEGLRFEEEGPPPGEGPLAEKTFVLTGTLPNLTREQATELIMAAGGKVTGSVSRNTAYVVAGASPGSKLAQAERLGVQAIDEEALRQLVDGRG